jgi:hypothetical protein
VTRTFVADGGHAVQTGDTVACDLCHSLSMSFA